MSCECERSGFCSTLDRWMPPHLHRLCQTDEKYRELFALAAKGNLDPPPSLFPKHGRSGSARTLPVEEMISLIRGPMRTWPDQWHLWPVTHSAHRILAERFLESLPPRTEGESGRRGIVTTGGGRYLLPAYVLVRLLRELGCDLPIEVWFLGPKEMSRPNQELLVEAGATCVNALEMARVHPMRILTGWPLKPYAMLHSSFEEVLWLDADNLPLRDPTDLFEQAAYANAGTVAWPDIGHHRIGSDRLIWKITGVAHRNEWEWESGQLLIDKRRCWRALNLTVHYNEHSDFYYHHLFGDKDTFHLAWLKTETPFAMPRRGTRPTSWGLLQFCPETHEPLFQHLAGPGKWRFYAKRTPLPEAVLCRDRFAHILSEASPLVR